MAGFSPGRLEGILNPRDWFGRHFLEPVEQSSPVGFPSLFLRYLTLLVCMLSPLWREKPWFRAVFQVL